MKTIFNKILITAVLFGSISITVNAAQTDAYELIMENTAFSLGLEEGQFSIFNLKTQGVKTTYQVNAQSGKEYSCYVTGINMPTGPVVSDAMCHEKGKPFQNPLLR